jgi:hypothetical protein
MVENLERARTLGYGPGRILADVFGRPTKTARRGLLPALGWQEKSTAVQQLRESSAHRAIEGQVRRLADLLIGSHEAPV